MERAVDSGQVMVVDSVDDRSVHVEDDDEARDRLDHRGRRVALALKLDFAALALGHVDAADQEHRPLVDLGQRGARPGDQETVAGACHPVVVVLADFLTRHDAFDQPPDLVRLRRIDVPLPEEVASGLGRLVVEQALERLVRRVVGDRSRLVDQAEETRRVVRDRVQERPLALLLLGEPLTLGDVHAARDDALDRAVRPEHGRGAPGDDAFLALLVGEDVLVLACGEVGREGVEALDRTPSRSSGLMKTSQKYRPRTSSWSSSPAAATAARFWLRMRPFGVDADEQARRGVRDRGHHLHLSANLCLQALVLQRQAGRGGDGVHELSILRQRCVVDEGRDREPDPLDERHGAPVRRLWLGHAPAVRVDPLHAAGQAVGDLERRVVQRLCERIADRDARPGARRRRPSPTDGRDVPRSSAEHECHRDRGERDERQDRPGAVAVIASSR